MTVRFRLTSFLTALLIASSQPVMAAQDDALGMVTGPKTGTYIAIGRDIAKVAKEKANLTIDVKESGGSIDNIKRISSGENAALGIVQSDVLGFLSRSKNQDSVRIANNLRMVFPFYKEEVHVLARKDIKNFAGLKGKRVIIGEEGSGNMLTAVNLFSMTGVTPKETVRVTPPEGIVAVLKGEADAAVFVGGKPVRLFKNLEELKDAKNTKYSELLKQVHFLALNEPKMLEEYKPAELTKEDYNFITEPVPTIAVTAVLVSYDFASNPKYKNRCARLQTLGDTLRANMDELKQNGHPKWKEVQLDGDVGIWKKDSCAWPEGDKTTEKDGLGEDLMSIIKEDTGEKPAGDKAAMEESKALQEKLSQDKAPEAKESKKEAEKEPAKGKDAAKQKDAEKKQPPAKNQQ